MAYTEILNKLASNLVTAYNDAIFTQSSNMGDSREKAVISYLTKVMAYKYGFQSGEIFDQEGQRAKQMDIIIYDQLFSTIFTDGTDKIIAPVESTYGVISVKSLMNTSKLDMAIEEIKSYDALKRPTAEKGKIYIMPDLALQGESGITLKGPSQQNINCIFAFDTNIAIETIIEKMKDANCIDLLVIPGKLCAIGRSRKELEIDLNKNILSNYVFKSSQAIVIFILLLQLYLSRNRLIAGNLEGFLRELLNDPAQVLFVLQGSKHLQLG